MAYVLGNKSRQNMQGVHPHLVKIVERAIELTSVDFMVNEGVRTRARQTKLVASGASQTMDSRHIPSDKTGYGHAVDLVPVIDFDGDGKSEPRWDWSLCYSVAAAVRRASIELKIPLRWGGVWDMPIADLDADPEVAVAGYVERRKALGKKAFLDGPHFELPIALYP